MKLPIKEPIIKGYKHHALPLSIIKATNPSAFESILPAYLQLYTISDVISNPDCDPHWLDYCLHEYLTEMNPNPLFQVTIVDRRNILPEKMKNFITDSLEDKKYIYINYDGFYLNHNVAFEKFSTINNLLIYGYDHDQRICNIYDYNYVKSRALEEMNVGIEKLAQAISLLPENSSEWSTRIILLDPSISKKQGLSITSVIQPLQDYLNSTATFDRYMELKQQGHSVMPLQSKPVYGIDVYRVLQTYTNSILPHIEHPNILPYYIIMEHKRVIEETLKLIVFDGKDQIMTKVTGLINMGKVILNKIIKYDLTRNKKILQDISNNLLILEQNERVVLNEVVDRLEAQEDKKNVETNFNNH